MKTMIDLGNQVFLNCEQDSVPQPYIINALKVAAEDFHRLPHNEVMAWLNAIIGGGSYVVEFGDNNIRIEI